MTDLKTTIRREIRTCKGVIKLIESDLGKCSNDRDYYEQYTQLKYWDGQLEAYTNILKEIENSTVSRRTTARRTVKRK